MPLAMRCLLPDPRPSVNCQDLLPDPQFLLLKMTSGKALAFRVDQFNVGEHLDPKAGSIKDSLCSFRKSNFDATLLRL